MQRREIKKVSIMLEKRQLQLNFCVCVVFILCVVSMCFCICVVECYVVLLLPVVEMEGDMAGCSLSEEGEC